MTQADKEQRYNDAIYILESVLGAKTGAPGGTEAAKVSAAIASIRDACPTCPSPSNPPPA